MITTVKMLAQHRTVLLPEQMLLLRSNHSRQASIFYARLTASQDGSGEIPTEIESESSTHLATCHHRAEMYNQSPAISRAADRRNLIAEFGEIRCGP